MHKDIRYYYYYYMDGECFYLTCKQLVVWLKVCRIGSPFSDSDDSDGGIRIGRRYYDVGMGLGSERIIL